MVTSDQKFTCIICGYKTLDSRCEWDICPVCFWEDGIFYEHEVDRRSSANRLTVSEAQANFMRFGAVDKKFLDNVRKPLPDEERDEKWAPLRRAVELAQEAST